MRTTVTAPRWIAQDEWCGEDLTALHPHWVGERCRLRKDHITRHSPIFGWPSQGNDDVFAYVQVEPTETLWDPERIEYITDSMERSLLLDMWRVGYSPVCPTYWEMWIEVRDGNWLSGMATEAHFKVRCLGVPVRRDHG